MCSQTFSSLMQKDNTRSTHNRSEEFNPGPRNGVDGGRLVDVVDIVNEVLSVTRSLRCP